MNVKGKKVFVGMSGGVDSSVSAYLLKKAGYDVTGVFIKVWQPDFVPCTWKEDRLDAMRVAASLNIPFKTLNLEKEYKEGVIDYMIEEYKAGRTPNPDVFCNKEVKFGAFLNWAIKNGANYVATGHYAQNKSQLLKGKDDSKDQSYFLWTLTEEQLKHILFPVGGMKKTEVRKIAEKAGLATANKKDSQGLCFISNIDMKQFLKHFIKEKKGNVIDEKGKVLGKHSGVVFHTIGERGGFEINEAAPDNKPYYVVKKDVSKNEIIVSHVPHAGESFKSKFLINNINFVSKKENDFNCVAQIRYHGEFLPCQVSLNKKENTVTFKKPTLVSSGQSIVFYDKEVCLGGGIIN